MHNKWFQKGKSIGTGKWLQKEAKLVVPTKYRSGTCKWFQQNEDLAHKVVLGTKPSLSDVRGGGTLLLHHCQGQAEGTRCRGTLSKTTRKYCHKFVNYLPLKSNIKIIAKDRQRGRDVGALYQRQPENTVVYS